MELRSLAESAGSHEAFSAACFVEADSKAAPEADTPATCGAAGCANGRPGAVTLAFVL